MRFWNVLIGMVLLMASGCAAHRSATQTPAAPTSAQAGNTTVVAVASPAPAKTTLPEFLGLTALCEYTGGAIDYSRNCLGQYFPALEATPQILSLTDPANADSANPAVQGAADIKAEEDAAAQKIKAIRYLATLGCSGCYPGIDDMLLAALDDCTEKVRYEAVTAIRSTAGEPCACCKESSCCSQKILKKLDELGYRTHDNGCFKEPSPRVRRIARLAMYACGTNLEPSVPQEGPTEELPQVAPSVSIMGAARQNSPPR